MKIAQEIRAGNVVMISGEPMVVLKSEYSKSGRNASVCKMKMKNLLTGSGLATFLFLITSFQSISEMSRIDCFAPVFMNSPFRL